MVRAAAGATIILGVEHGTKVRYTHLVTPEHELRMQPTDDTMRNIHRACGCPDQVRACPCAVRLLSRFIVIAGLDPAIQGGVAQRKSKIV
jgi:hypothetical protein